MALPVTQEAFYHHLVYTAGASPQRKAVYDRAYTRLRSYWRDKEWSLATVITYLDTRRAQGVKESTINVDIRYIHHLCECAGHTWHQKIKYQTVQEIHRDYLTSDEVTRLISTHPPRSRDQKSLDDRYDLAIITLLATGMRREELCGLTWDCLEGDTLIVRSTKNRAHKACVLLPELRQRIATTPRISPWIFSIRAGKQPRAQTINDEIKRRCELAGIKKDISAHCLRYTAAKEAAKRGANIAFIQKFLGHKSVNTTAKYIQADEDDVRSVATRLTVNLPYVDKEYAVGRIDALISELQIAGFRCDREMMCGAVQK